MAREQFKLQIELEEALARGEELPAREKKPSLNPLLAEAAALTMIPIIELCRYCPGMITAMGVSMGLTGQVIMSKGTLEQRKRWALDLLTMEKIGAWAITEPESGSDAFGSIKASARRDGEEFLLNGNKTFITNGPYADTIVFICKLDEGNARRSVGSSLSCSTRACRGSSRPSPCARWASIRPPQASCF